MWSRAPISFFILMDALLSVHDWLARLSPPHSCKMCPLRNQTFYTHESVSGFALLSHQSIYPALYQNHSMQMYLNRFWPRPCSLGIRRLKVICSQISKDLENQLEKPGLDLESKVVPQHVRKQKREILNEHLRKTFLGVKSSLSMGVWGWEKNVGVIGVVQG